MRHTPESSSFINTESLSVSGLTPEIISAGIDFVYEILDAIDEKPRFRGRIAACQHD